MEEKNVLLLPSGGVNSWRWTDETSEGEKLPMINGRWCVYGPEVGRVLGSQECVGCVYLRCCFSSVPTAAPQNDCGCACSTAAPPGGGRLLLGHASSRKEPMTGRRVPRPRFHDYTSKRKIKPNNNKS